MTTKLPTDCPLTTAELQKMDIYKRKSRWKWYLAAAGAVIVLISMFYTKYLTDRLEEEELKKVEQLGGKTVVPKMDIPGMGSLAFFAGPHGNIIGLATTPT